MGFEFGVPTRAISTKVEKYEFPVITLEADKGKGFSRKMAFNKAAVLAIGMVESKKIEKASASEAKFVLSVSFGFVGGAFLANTSGSDEPNAIRYSKTSDDLANKRVFKHLVKMYNLDSNVDNEFKLVNTGEAHNGFALFKLEPLSVTELQTANSQEKEDIKEAVANTSEGVAVNVSHMMQQAPAVPSETVQAAPVMEEQPFTHEVPVQAEQPVAPEQAFAPEFNPNVANDAFQGINNSATPFDANVGGVPADLMAPAETTSPFQDVDTSFDL